MLVHNDLIQFKVSKQLKRKLKTRAKRNKLGLSAYLRGLVEKDLESADQKAA